MRGITKDINDRNLDDFMAFAKRLEAEGATREEIERAFRNHLDIKRHHFFHHKPTFEGKSAKEIIEAMALKEKMADSNMERRFYDYLLEASIPFEFQKPVGNYRVDFLIANYIACEVDGPHHEKQTAYDARRDKFLEEQGFKVIRIPTWLLSIDPMAFIQELKEMTKEAS